MRLDNFVSSGCMIKQTVPVPESEKGLYLRGQVWWFRFPMVRGLQRKPVTLETTDKSEAIERRVRMLKMPEFTAASLLAEVDLHLKDMVARGLYTRATAGGKKGPLERFAKSLPRGIKLADVSPEQVKIWYRESLDSRSPGTVHKQWMDVRALFTWAMKAGRAWQNPALGAEEEKPARPVRVLHCEIELMDQLIGNCPREDLKFILMTGFHAGFRRNEMLYAIPSWFDFRSGMVNLQDTDDKKFNPTKRARSLSMRSELREFLLTYGTRTPFMLRPDVKHRGGIYRWDFSKPYNDYMKTQMWDGEDCTWVTPHVLRHTFASLLAQQGNLSLWEISQAMGNSEDECRRVYAHMNIRYRSNIELVRKPTIAIAA